MELKNGYKRTEFGIIPEEWEIVLLRECIVNSPSYGINAPATKFSEDLPTYIRITDITEDGRFSRENLVSVEHPQSSHYILQKGDLVFARTGASVGKSYLYEPSDGQLIFAGFLIRVKVDETKLIAKYLSSYVTTGWYWNWVKLMSMRSGQPGINGVEYAQLPIILPPLPEQHAIAEVLSDIDAQISALDQLIAKKRDIKHGAMQELLTGKRRLPGFSGNWSRVRLKEAAEIDAGINKPLSSMGSGTLYVTVQDLYQGTEIDVSKLGRIQVSPAEIQDKQLTEGDIIFGKSSVKREGIGYPSQFLGASEPAVFSGFTYRARARHEICNSRFLFYYLRLEKTRQWLIDNSQASALTNINQSIADNIPLMLPSVAEQLEIAFALSSFDSEIEALENERTKIRQLKQGMAQELLSGRTRII